MIDYSAIILNKLIIHKVGNKHKSTPNQVSNSLTNFDDDLSANLINYFLTPFSKQGEVNKFVHDNDLESNELYKLSRELFKQPQSFKELSADMLDHLYEQSENPQIKPGEVLVAYFTDIIFDDELTDALGIIKIEKKQKYFKLSESVSNIGIKLDTGINARKFDKGCLIINMKTEDGFRVLSVDNNNYDADYWKKNFLSIKYVKDFYYHTSNYVDFCKSFSEDVLHSSKGKDEQIVFLNKSMNYLTKNEEFDINEFAEEVFDEPESRKEFFDYKNNFERDREIEVKESFPIAQNTVKVKKKDIKSFINLDTDIQIKLNAHDPEKSRQYLERGYDRERGMNYYKVFYYSETL